MSLKKLLLLSVAIILLTPIFSQDKKLGSISGEVKDARSKSPLIEAVITISSDAFKGKRFTLTDSTGAYHVFDLPSGNYTISSEMEGYEKFVKDKLELQNGMALEMSFEMIKEEKAARRPK